MTFLSSITCTGTGTYVMYLQVSHRFLYFGPKSRHFAGVAVSRFPWIAFYCTALLLVRYRLTRHAIRYTIYAIVWCAEKSISSRELLQTKKNRLQCGDGLRGSSFIDDQPHDGTWNDWTHSSLTSGIITVSRHHRKRIEGVDPTYVYPT
jgi:hypothetical protein